MAGGAGYASSAPQRITIPPRKTVLAFTVRRADQFIFGQLTDEAGNPLCRVRVEATGDEASGFVFTDRSGRFVLRVPGGAYTIRASRNDYPLPATQTLTVPPTAAQVNLVLQLLPAANRSLYLPLLVSAP
jgi:hypothetical protein